MKEVILLGTAPSRKFCPFDVETWGVNGVYTIEQQNKAEGKPFRLDKIFITDHTFSPEGTLHFDIDVMNKIGEDYKCQFITLHRIQLGTHILKSIPYPYKRIVKKFKTDYFTSSIAYMMAYALDRNYEKIRFYGVDMASTMEYYTQKAGVEYWIGRAHERGCIVEISQGSVLMVPPTFTPYGVDRKLDLKKIDPYGLLDKK